jgi:hypothetical protein
LAGKVDLMFVIDWHQLPASRLAAGRNDRLGLVFDLIRKHHTLRQADATDDGSGGQIIVCHGAHYVGPLASGRDRGACGSRRDMDVAALLGGPPHSCRRQSSLKSVVSLTRFRVSEEGGLFETRAAARPVSTTSAIGERPPSQSRRLSLDVNPLFGANQSYLAGIVRNFSVFAG